jgi:hypothetical protein
VPVEASNFDWNLNSQDAAVTSLTPSYDHIVVVVEENHSLSGIIGNPQAPYINSLANGGALLSNYHAVTHPSQPNYFALYAGSTFGVADDGNHVEPGLTLATILQMAGKTFMGYIDAGSPRKHNPWESFSEGLTVERDFSAFPSGDFPLLPAVSFVIPNLVDDMHDGTVAQGDHWLQSNLGGYAQWALTHNSLLIVVWDEDDFLGTNLVPAILYGAHVKTGQYTTSYNHYDLLNTLLTANNLQAPNNAANAMAIGNGVFINSVKNDFNGDGFSDVLWRNNSSGDTGYSDVHDDHSWHGLGASSTAYSVVATGDFNGDGFIDALWRDNSSGHTGYTDFHGNAWHDLGVSSTAYSIVGVGDFNGDRFSDILYRNAGTGDTGYSDQHNAFTWHGLGAASTAYNVVGTGDFNGDGFDDILWRNNSSGDTGYTDLHAGNAWHGLGISSTAYNVVGIGDFNGDGFSDALWRNNTSGDTGYSDFHAGNVWNGLGASSTAYNVVAVGDYSGDGFDDILYRNAATGDTGYADFHAHDWHGLGAASTSYLVVA